MGCRCSEFGTIELYREDITERIKRTRTLRRTLDQIAHHPLEEHKLFRCGVCDQFWQISRAWGWGNFEYLFKVPAIKKDDWETQPFQQPDEIFAYLTSIFEYEQKNSFELTSRVCKRETCSESAIQYSVLCKIHHIEDLQDKGGLARKPTGRPLPDYDL